jgi:hypothetical protein
MSRTNGPREGSHAYLIPGQRERVETWRIPRNRGYQEKGVRNLFRASSVAREAGLLFPSPAV